jgi:hypothetical protein
MPKEGGLLALITGGKGKPEDDDEMSSGGKVAAARDIIAAVKSGDARALADALDEFRSAPKRMAPEDEEDEDE